MMKLGQVKVPIDRIPDLAEACGVDPARFMRIALREYQPELLELIESHVADLLTLSELRMVDCRVILLCDGYCGGSLAARRSASTTSASAISSSFAMSAAAARKSRTTSPFSQRRHSASEKPIALASCSSGMPFAASAE